MHVINIDVFSNLVWDTLYCNIFPSEAMNIIQKAFLDFSGASIIKFKIYFSYVNLLTQDILDMMSRYYISNVSIFNISSKLLFYLYPNVFKNRG